MFVEVAEILPEIVDGDAAAGRGGGPGFGLSFKRGNAFTQHRDEVAHNMGDGMLHAEDVGIEIALRNVIANLAGQAGIELILGYGLHDLAGLVGGRSVGIIGHINGLRGDRDLIDFLPRPLEIGSSRHDDAYLGILVALLLFRLELRGERRSKGGCAGNAFGASKGGLHRPLVLVDRVDPAGKVTHHEPDHEADNDPNSYVGVHEAPSSAPVSGGPAFLLN